MDIPNIDVGLSSMLLSEIGAVNQLQGNVQTVEDVQKLLGRAQTLTALTQAIAVLNQTGITSIDRSIIDEFLARAKLEGLLS